MIEALFRGSLRRVLLRWAILLPCLVTLGLRFAYAAEPDYPTGPIRFVVAFSAGGSDDLVARILAAKMSQNLHQPVVVENDDGAAGVIGTRKVANSRPDGYTILLATMSTQAVMANASKQLYAQLLGNFEPVALIGTVPFVLAGSPSLIGKDLKEVVAQIKKDPGAFSYANSGTGSAPNLTMGLFKVVSGIGNILAVPYKGVGSAVVDLLAGRVNLLFGGVPALHGYIQAGQLAGLGVTSNHRASMLPDVPTFAQQGYADMTDANLYYGILVPKGTPEVIVDRLNASVNEALQQPDTRKQLQGLALDVMTATPAEAGRFLHAQYEQWGKAVHAAHIHIPLP